EILNTMWPNTYGIYLEYIDNYEISENKINVTYGIYLEDDNEGISVTHRSALVNTMIMSGGRGIDLKDEKETDIYHNNIIGNQILQVNNQENIDVRNNILSSEGNVVFSSTGGLQSGDVIDYNLYYTKDTASDLIKVGSATYADLSDWKAADATRNINSLEIDPVFASAVNIHIKSTSPAIDAGDNSVTVSEDIDGHLR